MFDAARTFLKDFIGTVTWRTLVVAVLALGAVGLVSLGFKLGGSAIADRFGSDIESYLQAARDTPWALAVVVGVFVGLGFTGFPQFVLIAATSAVFGAPLGFAYSWAATMVSALIHFVGAKRFGNRLLRRHGGERVNVLSQWIGKNGIVASAVVRLVPSAPFIVVNCAAGISHMPLWKFALGTGVGIVPKAFLVAFVGGSVMAFISSQDPKQLLLAVAFLVAWIALALTARVLWRRKGAKSWQAPPKSED